MDDDDDEEDDDDDSGDCFFRFRWMVRRPLVFVLLLDLVLVNVVLLINKAKIPLDNGAWEDGDAQIKPKASAHSYRK
jgi:hypothetical protein